MDHDLFSLAGVGLKLSQEQINWMSEQGLPVGDLTVKNGTNGDVIVTASAAQVELSQTCVETLLYPKQKCVSDSWPLAAHSSREFPGQVRRVQ